MSDAFALSCSLKGPHLIYKFPTRWIIFDNWSDIRPHAASLAFHQLSCLCSPTYLPWREPHAIFTSYLQRLEMNAWYDFSSGRKVRQVLHSMKCGLKRCENDDDIGWQPTASSGNRWNSFLWVTGPSKVPCYHKNIATEFRNINSTGMGLINQSTKKMDWIIHNPDMTWRILIRSFLSSQ